MARADRERDWADPRTAAIHHAAPSARYRALIWSSIMIRIMLKHFSPSYEGGGGGHLSEFYGRHRKSLQLTELLPTHFHFNTILSLFKA